MFLFFFFNDTATTEIYTLSLHDALPISLETRNSTSPTAPPTTVPLMRMYCRSLPMCSSISSDSSRASRSEEHTSELQSQSNLVCRLLLEKKKKKKKNTSQEMHIVERLYG